MLVFKKNGQVRICVDLKHLNASVQREKQIMPAVDDIWHQLSGSKVFIRLDVSAGFWRILLDFNSVKYSTLITWPFDVTELFPRLCSWTLIWLSHHWAWLRRGYWRYRSLIDLLIDWLNTFWQILLSKVITFRYHTGNLSKEDRGDSERPAWGPGCHGQYSYTWSRRCRSRHKTCSRYKENQRLLSQVKQRELPFPAEEASILGSHHRHRWGKARSSKDQSYLRVRTPY